MRTLFILLAISITFGISSCKKDKEEAPTTGTLQIIFSGTPPANVGDNIEFYFAKDLYHLQTNIFSFTKTSKAPHNTIIMQDIAPQDWYYKQYISTNMAPWEKQGTIKVEAGKTATITVEF